MQTGIAVHGTDQVQGIAMDNNPDRGSSRKEQQMSAITRTTSVAVRVTLGLALAAWAAEPPSIPNRGAAEVQGAVQIVVGKRATALERYAAKELQRHLHAVFGVYGALADDGAPLDRPSCLVGRPESNARIAALIENKTIHLAQGDPGGAVKCDRSDSVIWAWFSEG